MSLMPSNANKIFHVENAEVNDFRFVIVREILILVFETKNPFTESSLCLEHRLELFEN